MQAPTSIPFPHTFEDSAVSSDLAQVRIQYGDYGITGLQCTHEDGTETPMRRDGKIGRREIFVLNKGNGRYYLWSSFANACSLSISQMRLSL